MDEMIDSMHVIGTDLGTTGRILKRDGSILTAAGH
jgi:hypothetical protein